MQRALSRSSTSLISSRIHLRVAGLQLFSTSSEQGGGNDDGRNVSHNSTSETGSDTLGWDLIPSWSSGVNIDPFEGVTIGQRITASPQQASNRSSILSENIDYEDSIKSMNESNKKSHQYVNSWGKRLEETTTLLEQVHEPGVRGSYLKDSEKAEMYRLHKENPDVYTVEKLAKDFRVMRQRVHAILWLKEDEEKMEKKLGRPLDDAIERLLDNCPEFFNSHCREFHLASLAYKPDFKVMPEGWDGTTKDPDEVHYEISKREDEMLYEEFVQRFSFNKMKMEGEVKCHKYSRRRPSEGWDFTVEKLGADGRRGGGGGWKFVSKPDGSSRVLNEVEKIYLKREKPRRRRKWWWQGV